MLPRDAEASVGPVCIPRLMQRSVKLEFLARRGRADTCFSSHDLRRGNSQTDSFAYP